MTDVWPDYFGYKAYKMSSRVIRIYNDDKSKHWSAVRVGDGRILEVKNPDGPTRGYFATEEEWNSACIGPVVVTADTHGFKYDWARRSCCCWTNWIYDCIVKFTPHLLERSDVRDAFNTLVDFFNEYDGKAVHHMSFGTRVTYGGWLYYSGYLSSYGPPVHFPKGPFGTGPESAWTRMHDLWRSLRPLLGDLIAALEKNEKVERLKLSIKWQKEREYRARCRAARHTRDWEKEKKVLADYEEKLAALTK